MKRVQRMYARLKHQATEHPIRIILTLSASIAGGVVFWAFASGRFFLFDGTEDTRRNVLSTLSSVLSTLFGTLVGLGAVAMQLAAQTHTPHAPRLLMRNAAFRSFLAGSAGLLVLTLALLANGSYIKTDSDVLARLDEALILVLSCVWLGTVVWGVVYVARFLTPAGLAQELAKAITPRALSESRQQRFLMTPEEYQKHQDVCSPLSDMALAALERGHVESANMVIRMLVVHVLEAMGTSFAQGDQTEDGLDAHVEFFDSALDHLCSHIQRILSHAKARENASALEVGFTLAFLNGATMAYTIILNGRPKLDHLILRLVRKLPKEYDDEVIGHLQMQGVTAVEDGKTELAQEVVDVVVARCLVQKTLDYGKDPIQPLVQPTEMFNGLLRAALKANRKASSHVHRRSHGKLSYTQTGQ